jgi:hypothetical protein
MCLGENMERRYTEFTKELCTLINRCSLENGSNTPDFVLAEYLTGCLQLLDTAAQAKQKLNYSPKVWGECHEKTLETLYSSDDLKVLSSYPYKLLCGRVEALQDTVKYLMTRIEMLEDKVKNNAEH